MKTKNSSLAKNAIKISGVRLSVEDALLSNESLETLRSVSSAATVLSTLETDQNRLCIYLGSVSDIDVVHKQRGEFFTRIDGSYYGAAPRVDTSYTQGDYSSSLGKQIALGFMPASMKARMAGDEKTADALEVLAMGETEQSVAFGYVNDEGVPCGLEILTFKENNQPHYIISHTDHLDKPKSERTATVYMNPELNQLLKSHNIMQVDQVMQAKPEQISQTSVAIGALPQDLYATVNSIQLSQELQGLFSDKQASVNLSYGGFQGEKEKHPVVFKAMEFTSLAALPENKRLPESASPLQAFRHAALEQRDQASENNELISSNLVADLLNQQWANFVSNVQNEMPALDSGKLSKLVKTSDFKQKLAMQHISTELEQLKHDISNGKIENPREEVEKVLAKMGHSTGVFKEFAAQQQSQFELMAQYEDVYKANVGKVNVQILCIDPLDSSQESRASSDNESTPDPEEQSSYRLN